mgnify:CR=1 FL=1
MPRSSFFIVSLMFFTVSFGVAAMAALIPSIAVHFGVAQNYTLKLTWLYMLPYGLIALIWAPISRMFTIRRIFLFTSFGFFVSTLFFSLSENIHQAFVFRFLMGCFGCSFVPLSLITIAKTVSPKKKSKYIGTFFGISYISTFVSVFLSGFMPWQWLYRIPAILSLLAFALVLWRLHDFDFRQAKFKINYFKAIKDKKALRFFLVIMLASSLYHSVQQRLGMYLSQTFDLRQLVISTIFTVSTLCAIASEFLGGFLGSKLGNIKITRIGFIMMSLFVLSLLFVKEHEFLFFVIVLWGAGWALTHVGLSTHLTHFPDNIQREASSLNSSFRFTFGWLGVVLGGFFVGLIGFKAFFILVALSIFILGFNMNKIIAEEANVS